MTKTIVPKPWGRELIWAHTVHYAAKILEINAGSRLSLQTHNMKHESLMVLTGFLTLEIEINGVMVERVLGPGETANIPSGTKHRFSAAHAVRLVEVSTPELDDVVRHEDDYGRCYKAA